MKKLILLLALIILAVSAYLNIPYLKAAKMVYQKIVETVNPLIKKSGENTVISTKTKTIH